MVQTNYKSFPSKILLFGEYLVLQDGTALSYPHHEFSLSKSDKKLPQNKPFFLKLAQYIQSNELLKSKLSTQFLDDINKGLNFDSTIPSGYGLGSSGALVAAIYYEYFLYQESDIKLLKYELSEIESFFHDKSSGIDPLTAYIQKPILSSKGQIITLDEMNLGNFSLYNSRVRRQSKEAVKIFQKNYQNLEFKKAISELKELNESMITKWLDHKSITHELKKYSEIQLQYFSDFIPENVQAHWKQGLVEDQYYMKLCGAGMGGMYLQFENK